MGTPERDIMARFIQIADEWPLRRMTPFHNPEWDRIPADQADSYRVARDACEDQPQLAYNAAMNQYAAQEARVFADILAGLSDDATRFNIQTCGFVAFCMVCIYRKGAEDIYELARHPETGQESNEA